MKKRIDINWSQEAMDLFLNNNYGFGLWEFEALFVITFGLYIEKEDKIILQHIEKRIKQLETQKKRTIESLDDFLEKGNFYKLDKIARLTSTQKWTPKIRENYIIKHYKLKSFFSVIDSQISYLSSQYEQLKDKGTNIFLKIKPINFLTLIFSHAMKRGQKVDWINMEILFNWFSRSLKIIDVLHVFYYEEDSSHPPEILRLIRNKYINKHYGVYATIYFELLFKEHKDEGKQKFPKPLDEIENFWCFLH